LARIISTHPVVFEDALVQTNDVVKELRILIRDYLRPSFLQHPRFTQIVGFSQVIKLLQEIRSSLQPNVDLVRLRSEYLEKIAEKFEIIPLQGISPKVGKNTIGVRMEDVFVPIKLKPDMTVYHHLHLSRARRRQKLSSLLVESPGETGQRKLKGPEIRSALAEISKGQGKSLLSTILTWSSLELEAFGSVGIDKLLSVPQVVLQGDPGSGKSTLTRYIAWAVAKRPQALPDDLADKVPVLIAALDFGAALESGRVSNLESYLLTECDRFAPAIEKAISSGKAIVLIDGLDEVSKPGLRAHVKERVDDFLSDPMFAENRMIITSRIVGYQRTGRTGQFLHFVIQELDNDNIHQYVKHWYKAVREEMPGSMDVEKEAQEFHKTITGNDSFLKMARNPLLLTIILLMKLQGRDLPSSRVQLYDAATQTLIRNWPLLRGADFDELFIREWLAPVAYHILADRTGELIDEDSLMSELVDSMRKLKSMTPIEAKSNSAKMLEDIGQHSGFILPKGTDADEHNLYGFLHQTFAEYLSAFYLFGLWEEKTLDLRRYCHDPYWREVFLLFAGHLATARRANAGKLIEAVRNLNSSCYEAYLHRDVLVACEILCDGVPAGPPDIIESLLSELLKVWRETKIASLRTDIEFLFDRLSNTEYGPVLARIAASRSPSSETLKLATILGPQLFRDSLRQLLTGQEPHIRIRAAELLEPFPEPAICDAAYALLTQDSEAIRLRAVAVLINQGDPRGAQVLPNVLKNASWAYVLFTKPAIPATVDKVCLDAIARALDSEPEASSLNYVLFLAFQNDPRGRDAIFRLCASDHGDASQYMREMLTFSAPLRNLFTDEELFRMLQSSRDSYFRIEIAHELATRNNLHGVEELTNLAVSLTGMDKAYAAKVLAEFDKAAGVRALVDSLGPAGPDEKHLVAAWLAENHDWHGTETLQNAAASGDARIRLIALKALSGSPTPPPIEDLISLARNDEPKYALEGLQLLSVRKEREGLSELIAAFESGPPPLRAAAAQLLIESDDLAAFDTIKNQVDQMLSDVNPVHILDPDSKYITKELPSLADSARQFLKRYLAVSGRLEVSSRRA
jgi:HEAT repeat protein